MPLLLKLGETERALGKAIGAGDPDLVYLALFALQRSRSLPEAAVQAAIASRPLARSLYRAYCAQTVRCISVGQSAQLTVHMCEQLSLLRLLACNTGRRASSAICSLVWHSALQMQRAKK